MNLSWAYTRSLTTFSVPWGCLSHPVNYCIQTPKTILSKGIVQTDELCKIPWSRHCVALGTLQAMILTPCPYDPIITLSRHCVAHGRLQATRHSQPSAHIILARVLKGSNIRVGLARAQWSSSRRYVTLVRLFPLSSKALMPH